MKHRCLHCNKVFETDDARKLFCSPRCKKKITFRKIIDIAAGKYNND